MVNLLLSFVLFASFAVQSSSAAIESYDEFAHIPILEGGRVMPLDTFARIRLLQYSGKSTYQKQPAIDWLARTLFSPSAASGDKVFLINNPEVIQALGLEGKPRTRFSLDDLGPKLDRLGELARQANEVDPDNQFPVEKELINVFISVRSYIDLTLSMGFLMPNPMFDVSDKEVQEFLEFPEGKTLVSYLDLMDKANKLAQVAGDVHNIPQNEWTPLQQKLFQLAAAMHQWAQQNQSGTLTLLPMHGHGDLQWLSPGASLAFGFGSDALKAEIYELRDMALAFWVGEQMGFDRAARNYRASVRDRIMHEVDLGAIDLELKHNEIDPFYKAELFYGFGFLLVMLAMATNRRWLYLIALALILFALVPHTFGIVSRMLIMKRPPVTNLYATFIFVSWVGVLFCLITEWIQKNKIGLFCASLCGLILLLVAGKFSTQGDSMGVVIAVLDSNFWLATHVVAITIGYSGVVVAGIIGHVYLIQAIFKPGNEDMLKSTERALYGALAFGLIFSFLGTMLGGVWADQSWGRFWGWDPKENGALLIVLWCGILFHAKIARMIGPVGMAAGAVFGVVVVLCAWLGVNLLGVGLHSYGFTSGLAKGFYLSCGVEMMFIIVAISTIRTRVPQ